MTRRSSAFAAIFALALAPVMATAGSHVDADSCNSMLAESVGMQLDIEGFDTVNACDLTVAQLAEIKNLLTTEGMGARVRIEQILANEG